MAVLKRFGLGSSFLEWVEAVLKNHQSSVINAGTTSPYFKLEKGARQEDPISAYLFTLTIASLLRMAKTNQSLEGLDICDYFFPYSACADDTTFFLKNVKSVMKLLDMIDYFTNHSGFHEGFTCQPVV